MENLRLENEKLKEMRTTMDDEMHTLTENLFEEAYKMVDTVKEEKGVVSKRLADAAGKMDAMETEMSALKNLLQPAKADKKLTSGSASLDTGRDSGKKSPSQHHKHHRPNIKKVSTYMKCIIIQLESKCVMLEVTTVVTLFRDQLFRQNCKCHIFFRMSILGSFCLVLSVFKSGLSNTGRMAALLWWLVLEDECRRELYQNSPPFTC